MLFYDVSISVSSIKDWLKAHPSKTFRKRIETAVSGSAALSFFEIWPTPTSIVLSLVARRSVCSKLLKGGGSTE